MTLEASSVRQRTGQNTRSQCAPVTAMRWMLGTFEAGLFPGVNYYLSCWYKRSEFGIRAAIFFSAAAVAGSFGGLLAAAISNMNHVGGKPGWAWVFILVRISHRPHSELPLTTVHVTRKAYLPRSSLSFPFSYCPAHRPMSPSSPLRRKSSSTESYKKRALS